MKNLYLEKGVYAVLGLNGSGKSTLLNGLVNIVPFTKADIIYEDKSLEKKAIMLQQVYMFQGTVWDNLVVLPLKI
ncbi:ATP-binding cassette domain-containing protein [endosymbiont 'TC1' of Trimyema compressum]|uniref:ATP-binding cassette domain-containing protein n=1 Tax=endosymbiont 'TC1' of Trimyema compressum TaxID=243899 RepID=UPI000B4C31AD